MALSLIHVSYAETTSQPKYFKSQHYADNFVCIQLVHVFCGFKNCYDILQVPPDASISIIRKVHSSCIQQHYMRPAAHGIPCRLFVNVWWIWAFIACQIGAQTTGRCAKPPNASGGLMLFCATIARYTTIFSLILIPSV